MDGSCIEGKEKMGQRGRDFFRQPKERYQLYPSLSRSSFRSELSMMYHREKKKRGKGIGNASKCERDGEKYGFVIVEMMIDDKLTG